MGIWREGAEYRVVMWWVGSYGGGGRGKESRSEEAPSIVTARHGCQRDSWTLKSWISHYAERGLKPLPADTSWKYAAKVRRAHEKLMVKDNIFRISPGAARAVYTQNLSNCVKIDGLKLKLLALSENVNKH